MVDRGGLDYVISVRNQFSAQLNRLRKELRQTRAEFARLRTDTARGLGSGRAAAREQTQAQREVQRATRDTARESKRAAAQQKRDLRAIAAAQLDRSRRERDVSRIARQARRDLAIEERRRAQLAARAARAERTRIRELRRRRREQRRFIGSLLRTDNAANRISFTFRRLFGILAAFAVARLAVEAFARGIVGTGISINRTVEDSQISIAALITAVGEVRNTQGELVTGQEAFALATKEARRQVNMLRQDAIGTTATFEDLLKAFQSGIGPGLAAGLNLDEIRQVTLRISQAAAALTVPQNQLNEEIRSLLRGTIQARTTRIASVLGITNEDVRQAREAGTLFQFLSKRLDAFKFASDATQRSFSGLMSNVQDAISFAGGPAALDFFEELKTSLGDLIEIFVDIERDEEGVVERILPSPEAIATLSAIFDGLRSAVVAVREALASLRFEDVLGAATAIGAVIAATGSALAGFIQGVVEGLGFVVRLINQVTGAFGGVSLDGIREFVRQVTRIGVVLIAASVGAAIIRAAFSLLIAPLTLALRILTSVLSAVIRIGAALFTAQASMVLLLVGAIAALVIFKQWVDEVAGFEVKLSTLQKILNNLFLNTVQIVAQRIRTTFTTVFEGIRSFSISIIQGSRVLLARIATSIGNFFRNIISGILRSSSRAIDELAEKLPNLLGETRNQLIRLSGALSGAATNLTEGVKKNEADLAATITDATNKIAAAESRRLSRIADTVSRLKELEESLVRNFNDAINEDVDAPTIIELLKVQIAGLRGHLNEMFQSFGIDGDIINAEDIAAKLKKAVEEGLGSITGRAGKSKFEELFRGLADQVQAGLNIARGLVTSFSSFVSTSVVDAFDPTKDFDIKERFARFLQEIASLIIQQLTQIAIAKAVLSLGFQQGGQVGAAGLRYGGVVPQSLAEGGKISAASPSPTMAHYGLPGTQPQGIDPRDTQPIWAQPGEYMHPVSAVRRYGLDVMEKMKRGLIDPHDLRALASSVGNMASLRRSINRGPGFQEGGLIGDQIAQVREGLRGISDVQDQDATATGPTPAFIVADDQSVDRLLNGGRAAVLRFFRENSEEIDGLLRSSRPAGA